MMELVGELANDPESVAQRLVEVALRLTAAGSAGLSLAETEDGKEIFRWIATAGEYSRYLHGTMPRDFSPCGEVLRRGEPLLMRDMVRAYPYVDMLHEPPTEVLLVPFANNGKLVGTVWIVGHSPTHLFDEEDLRVVKSLAVFASAVSATVNLVRDLAARKSQLARELEISEQRREQLDRMMAERNQAAETITRELKDTRLLRDVASRLIGTEGSDALFDEILDAAISITQADAGTIQLHDKSTDTLTFLATRGFAPEIVAHFSRVDASSGSPCGIAFATGKRAIVEFRQDAPDPDGAVKWHLDAGLRSAQSTPLISRTGQPMGMFSTHWRENRTLSERELRFLDLLGRQAADLIERIEVEEALRSSEKALREGARRKDEFLAVLAHELRNPLAPIRTGIDLLKKAMHEPIVARLQPMMERQTSHMVRLIDDLLDVSRITSGKVVLQHETVTLGNLVEAAVEANRSAIAAAGLELQVQIDDPQRRLRVDPTRMSQVLSNVLHNAVKFTAATGKIILSTSLSGAPGQAQVEQVIRITDTGVGIAAETLPTIFELFTQVRPDSSKRHGGMGIGLALARSLVSLHGGTLSAESDGPGTGSTFVIRIPAPECVNRDSPPTAQAAASKLAGLRVLIVDDNEDAADALGNLLSFHGSEVRVSYLAGPAIDLLAEFDPEIVLLDIGLPFMDGYEACKRMRAMKGDAVRIVALTGWGQESDRRRAADAGFDAHLTKPVEFARLADAAFPGH
ncbi:autoinducer 2 sensor kinase/phosphatase LuxQ [Janthinobacterium sp. HH01]|nr:autoinducer 2 sensor kinase/phosphatase LuxQ [Janthinobacterium sp. HH01]